MFVKTTRHTIQLTLLPVMVFVLATLAWSAQSQANVIDLTEPLNSTDVSLMADDSSYIMDYETPIEINLRNHITSGGSLLPLTATLTTTILYEPLNGDLDTQDDGVLFYTPNPGFSGGDRLLYQVSAMGGVSNVASVAITVRQPDGAPPGLQAPTGLQVLNQNRAPVYPTYEWAHLGPQDHLAEYYQLLVIKTGSDDPIKIDQWYPASEICGGSQCSVRPTQAQYELFEVGSYSWYVIAWNTTDDIVPSEKATFSIDLQTPSQPSITGVELPQRRPVLIFNDNVDGSWINVRVSGTNNQGNTYNFQKWYQKTTQICGGNICQLPLDAYPANGNYTASAQWWGPGGLSGWSDGLAFTVDFVKPVLTGDLNASQPTPGNVGFSWGHAADAAWYNIMVMTPGNEAATITYEKWFSAQELTCADDGLCSITPLDLNLFPGTYDAFVQAWGPGGYAEGYLQTPRLTVEMQIPGLATPLSPGPDGNHTVQDNYTELVLSWQHVPQSSWYLVWMGHQQPPEVGVVHYEWHHALDLGCTDDGVCNLDLGGMYLMSGNYSWYLLTYNPMGYEGWSPAPGRFTVTPQ